ncbi:hypothetical protein EVAR_78280_1 [Eumeta japonica]|uniref:Uncharacterized protein n=1 Tax=Eumeta variegata TaxID=151549 RepID=A0A4C1T315_EUMVA|nr:hypothetical protein EVAR_78280_1 [Eumeta japonica]
MQSVSIARTVKEIDIVSTSSWCHILSFSIPIVVALDSGSGLDLRTFRFCPDPGPALNFDLSAASHSDYGHALDSGSGLDLRIFRFCLDPGPALNFDLFIASHSDYGHALDSDSGLDLRTFRFCLDPGPALNFDLSAASHSDYGHAFDSNFDPTLDFDLGLIFNFDLGLDLQFYFSSCVKFRLCSRSRI